ncbi:hypothetical protein P691DRAFT_811205 [Macrolepiota fuliginosa MF-IS2]|uniref:BHLH domain-containing protein n=1 Tax=Macrolepiota fuliginosa MF-IS2 TaxID=1400762 RepID=A0A9P5XFL1_9AGAR|nr:hypothetical protein P691DRAFT_811205 [Macrolepiota fuliginosa MF-IS2]
MALFTPAEANAFQNFLSAMDYQDLTASEWALFTGNGNAPSNDDLLASPQTSEALTKATKDLMALDTGRWDTHLQQEYTYTHNQPAQHSPYASAFSHRHTPYGRRETFPFLTNKSQSQQPTLTLPTQHADFQTHIASPIPTSATTTPATPQSPFSFSDLPSRPSPHRQDTQVHLGQPLLRHRPSSPGTKRSSPSGVSGAPQSAKRPRTSPPATSTSGSTSSNSASHLGSAAASAKQNLLSPSQKKANHIQSEQKRRANIRRGYEALCETVPALREAIKEEEEAEARLTISLGSSGKSSRSKRKKKDADAEKEKEKIDGRAGPRSENVVLSKTIDYINELLSERSTLFARLHRAKSTLPPGHSALVPVCAGEPLWEREWKGGEGQLDGDEDEENNDEGGDST